MKKFTRTICTEVIHSALVSFNEDQTVSTVALPDVTYSGGTIGRAEANKLAARAHREAEEARREAMGAEWAPTPGEVVVSGVDTTTQLYEMSIEDFVKYATKKEKTTTTE